MVGKISTRLVIIVISDSKRHLTNFIFTASYILTTRSGDRNALADMIRRCNAVGIRIYPDVVINHMAARTGSGTGGSWVDVGSLSFPAVPFGSNDFNPRCKL